MTTNTPTRPLSPQEEALTREWLTRAPDHGHMSVSTGRKMLALVDELRKALKEATS